MQPETLSFNHDIRPILSRHCFACHGPDSHDRQAGLRLDIRTNAIQELESGMRAIVPGKPEESILLHRMDSLDPGVMMPESGRALSHTEAIELIENWILSL